MFLPLLLGAMASVSTYAGGLLAIRFGQRRELLFALTGGMVVGLALLDLLPEALASGTTFHGADVIFGVAAIGMALYLLLHRMPAAGAIGRVSLILHSLMDGLGIGLAFQVSAATGWLVAVAVLAHDMADGANMVGLTALSRTPGRLHRWLLANAAAPLVGVVIGQAVRVDLVHFSLLLALFGGGFLYIGAAELLPRSRTGGGAGRTALASLVGIGAMACVVHLAG